MFKNCWSPGHLGEAACCPAFAIVRGAAHPERREGAVTHMEEILRLLVVELLALAARAAWAWLMRNSEGVQPIPA